MDQLCDKCIDGYILSADRLSCTASLVSDCFKYEVNTANCLLCNDGYYRDDLTTCTLNNISNCEIKHKFQNTCIKCNDTFIGILDDNNEIVECVSEI